MVIGSRPRLWLWIPLCAVVLAVTCCALPLAGWAVVTTIRASQAADTPTRAANAVIDSLDEYYDENLTRVLTYLADGPSDELRTELVDVRRKLSSEGTSYRLVISATRETQADDGVTVTIDVAIVSDIGTNGRALFIRTQDEPWTFHTVNDQGLFSLTKGWKVDAMEIPDICTVYYEHC
jgi:hypothetical protein